MGCWFVCCSVGGGFFFLVFFIRFLVNVALFRIVWVSEFFRGFDEELKEVF